MTEAHGATGKRVLSGIQPSGLLHLGNYIGALSQFVALQDEAECLFCVVDLHALTVPQDPEELREQTRALAALYLAAGIDPHKAVLFVQSHVPEHTELGWLLGCLATHGELSRMTQFKDKGRGQAGASLGLFAYPVLMAADILLYQATHVPVGDDQKQHLELTRDLAVRFNHRYGETFTVPEPLIRDVGSRIMGLDDPTVKMSKSAKSPNNYIALLDPPDVVRRKIARAVTDSEGEVRYDPQRKPAISNLLTIYHALTGRPIPELEEAYRHTGYAVFKGDLAEVIVQALAPLQERYRSLRADGRLLDDILAEGARRARALAAQTLAQVKDRMGLLPPGKGS